MPLDPHSAPPQQWLDSTGKLTRNASMWLEILYRKLGSATMEAPIKSDNITGLLASANQVTNAQLNVTNFCTVDSVDNGTTATLRVHGIGGVGTTWTRRVGTQDGGPYPAFTQAGLAYSTGYWVMYSPSQNTFIVTSSFPETLPDGYIWAGTVTTVAAGGAGGTTGGGGTGGGTGGCVEVGTPVIEPEGTTQEIEENSEWIGLQFTGHSPVNMHPETLVSVWVKASELNGTERIAIGKEGRWSTSWSLRKFLKPSRKVKRTCPGGEYLAGTALIRLHNMKVRDP